MGSELHSAIFDPGYRAHERFIARAREHLTEHGRILIGTADLGDEALLAELAAKSGQGIELLRRVRRIEVHRVMEYRLLELVSAR